MRFPSLTWMRGRKVVDRARGDRPPLNPAPPTPLYNIRVRHGIIICPQCGEKAAVLFDGLCCDCGPDIA